MIDRLSSEISGDLPEDLLGSQKGYLKLGAEDSVKFESTELDRVLGSWTEAKEGKIALVPNKECWSQVQQQEPKTIDAQEQRKEIIRAARWMIMHHEPITKVVKYLQRNAGVLSRADIAGILAERSALGEIYLDRNVTEKCLDVRKASQGSASRHAIFMVMAPCCAACKEKNGNVCPETGKRLIAGIPSTDKQLREATLHLMECGRIPSDVKISNWDDLKKAMAPHEVKTEVRMYPHASPVSSAPRLKINPDQQNAILREAAVRSKKTNEDVLNGIKAQAAIPIARRIAELLLTGTDWELARRLIDLYPDKAAVRQALEFLKKHSDLALLATHLAAFPVLYEGNCESCKAFLKEKAIKIAGIVPIQACKDCRHRQNPARTCSLLGAKIFEKGIQAEEANRAIDELHMEGMLTIGQARDLRTILDPRKRLDAAVRLAFYKPTRSAKRPERSHGPNALHLSAESFLNRANAVLWAAEALSRGATISQLEQRLEGKIKNAGYVISEAVSMTKTIHTDSLAASSERCAEKSYIFAPDARFILGSNCAGCSHSDALQCRRHGRFFVRQDLSKEETKEAKEILDFFSNSEIIVNVDPRSSKKSLDVSFENQGSEMIVEVGERQAPINDFQKLFEEPEINVEPHPRTSCAAPLEIEGLGAGEYDISSAL